MVITLQNQGKDRTLVVLAVIVFLIHLFIIQTILPKVDFTALTNKAEDSTLKIKILSQASRQIVQSTKSKEELEVKKSFLGKEKSTFARQTVAKSIGTFNVAGKGIRTAKDEKDSFQKTKKKKVSLSDLSFKGPKAAQESPRKQDQIAKVKKGIKSGLASSSGLSRSNDYVKDIPLGDFTRLNTQEFQFYGFYHRIRQKLEQFWGRNIQEQADKLMKSGRSIASGTDHITALQIELDHKGQIVNVRVNAKSGVKELDKTAVKTFNEAGPFPNPPKKMLKNGRAVINWSFVVKT